MKMESLRKFSKGNAFLILKILSRVFLIIFGTILLFDDLLWDNIGGLREGIRMAPTIGVIDIYTIGGIHIHHGWIGAILVFIASFSLVFIYINDIKTSINRTHSLKRNNSGKSFLNILKNFSKSNVFVGLMILSRVFLFLFGAFLLLDNLIWNNIGRVVKLNGLTPSIGAVESYSLLGIPLPHGLIGVLLMFISGFSLTFIYVNEIKNKK